MDGISRFARTTKKQKQKKKQSSHSFPLILRVCFPSPIQACDFLWVDDTTHESGIGGKQILRKQAICVRQRERGYEWVLCYTQKKKHQKKRTCKAGKQQKARGIIRGGFRGKRQRRRQSGVMGNRELRNVLGHEVRASNARFCCCCICR